MRRASRKKKSKFLNWFSALTKLKKTALILAVLLIISAGAAGATAYWYYHRISNLDRMFPDLNWQGDEYGEDFPDVDEVFDGRVLNILLMGFDRNEARDDIYAAFRPDTLMVAAINLDTGQVDLVSLPRDTLVPIYDRRGGRDKINHSYYYGWSSRITGITDPQLRHQSGLNSVVETVSMALKGVPIHYYVSICMDGVVEVVNIMGGVWYDVESNIYSNDGRLLVEEGYQRLNGLEFLYYVRNRQFEEGDVQRVQNQQDILIAAFDQFKKANKLVYAPQVYTSMRNNLETDLSLDQIAALALFATRNISSGNIHTHTIPGEFRYGRVHEGQASVNIYYIIDQQGRATLLKQVWGLNVAPDATDQLLPRRDPDDEPSDDSPDLPLEEEPPDDDPADYENNGENDSESENEESNGDTDDEENGEEAGNDDQ